MLWFEGSIPDAINLAKQRSSVFVVVITGEDDQSAQLISSWEDERVSEAARHCCVAIQVDAQSETCVQFSQIYPVVCIPSSFFIGENGIPLEVIAGSVPAEELKKRIHRVKQMHAQQMEGGALLPEAGVPVEATPANSSAPASAPASTAAPASVSSTAPGTADASSDHAAPSEDNLNAKVDRLTKKLEERREQKKRGEEEPVFQSEIKKEIERRKMGKDVQDLKKKQEEEKMRRLLEERNREKAEEKAARERVKQQIALDRADRAARYAQTKEEERASRQAALEARQAQQDARKESALRERSTIVRIQFRLPDGSSFTNQFPSQSRLQEARDFADQEVGKRYGKFSLATMFPRREFTSEDLNRTLLELELAPSASIVLLPSSRPAQTVVQSSAGGVWALLGTLLYPLLAMWRFLSSFLFTSPTPPGAAAAPRGPGRPSSSYPSSASASDKTNRETVPKHSAEKRPKDFKKDGKICRLRNQEDSEDDTNTWNGNSTSRCSSL
ncbi:UBX domain-containing protein 4 isoform X2 [Etheostoma spectabile]|uniref:UBX domain-containing protein 4 isoform X2 n=1 Tax=Etheostoma spectabile TaxID=54343 RepID=UPI0013AFC7FF|nr:UBX domain-containing protein 4 isoform X2 [Etheostoma spectabile]